ncbi:MAG: FAD/NAD(P)-binding protein [Beijerinckiaceae bacterium]|nr:FAD/NAD(P)-binding protein [Beijerinckiaceae bacterium]
MPIIGPRLRNLVQKLDALGPRPSLIDLTHAVEMSRLTLADVAPYAQRNPKQYNRAPVVGRENYELLVMTWLPGQASVPHDHNGSICVMRVVEGTGAIEGHYRVAADGFADLEYEEAVRQGKVTACQDASVHAVRNASSAGQVLVTVHVYAPPLRDLRRFVPRSGGQGGRRQMVPDGIPTVVIVGGGFSGSMTAAQILRRAGRAGISINVALVERRGAVGEGLAYATRDPAHLLNVRAGGMSAWPGQPDDFVEWASRRYGHGNPGDFYPRQWYGEYIRDTFVASAADAGKRAKFSVHLDEVRRVVGHPEGGWLVHLERGSSLRADAAVLAIGHRPPSDPIGSKWTGPRTRLISDPWRPFALNVVRPNEAAVVVGSGLTAVDTVLSLAGRPRTGVITLVSRNGLLPQAHAAAPLLPADLQALVSRLLASPGGVRARMLLQDLRRTARTLGAQGLDWRSVIDGLRPHTAQLWQAMPSRERRRFITRLRPFWEVHRHRMALPAAERFRAMLDRGEVRVIAGQVISVREDGNEVRVAVRSRENGRHIELPAGWVINCTGPMPSNSAQSNPVTGSLLAGGWLRTDELGLGVETNAAGSAIAAGGREVPDLFVVGTLRKPAFWESTAVPELREQAATAAARVLDTLMLHCQAQTPPSGQEEPPTPYPDATPPYPACVSVLAAE